MLVTAEELADALAFDEDDLIAELAHLEQVAAASNAVVMRMLDPAKAGEGEDGHDGHAWDREAALAVAVQVWQARSAPGGQMATSDFGAYASPHLLGPGLLSRVNGLIAPCRYFGAAVTVA